MASSSSSPSSHRWPPGFRFRPTDQELVGFYLARKVSGRHIQAGIIAEVDLYKCEPWDLPDKSSFENDVEWYFFSPRDKKYPNGSRTNRATEAGYWKATGKDRAVRSGSRGIGMKKTLVFYRGRAPHGQRTDWIMHEYRLEEDNQCQDGFVLCRVFRKSTAKNEEEAVPSYLDEDFTSSTTFCIFPSSSEKKTDETSSDVVVPPEPDTDEGQICSPEDALPHTIASEVTKEVGEEGTQEDSDNLDALLMELLSGEPTAEQSQLEVPGVGSNHTAGVAGLEFFDSEDLFLDQIQHSFEPSDYLGPRKEEGLFQQVFECQNSAEDQLEQYKQYVGPQTVDAMSGDLMEDLLMGDYIEMDDLKNLEACDDDSYSEALRDSALVDNNNKLAAPDWEHSMLLVEQNTSGPSVEYNSTTVKQGEVGKAGVKGGRLEKFLGYLGSVHVLPASAAEYTEKQKLVVKKPSSEVRVATIFTVTTTSTKQQHQHQHPQQQQSSSTKQKLKPKAKQKHGYGSNLFFVFLVGTLSALFWILLLPNASRLASSLHSAVLL